jgi:hypothetical protein
MPHKTRLLLFYTFVFLFLVAGTAVLLYSYGWRIDFETGKVQKIGAIYIKANVKDLTIRINNKVYPDDSGILQSGTLVSNLLPKTYRVEITKQGYLPYHKTVTVQPSRVEELLNVQLIPKTFEPTTIAMTKGSKFVDATGSGDRIIMQDTANGTYYLYDKAHASSTVNLNLAVANARRAQKIKRVMFVPFKPTQFIVEDATGLKLFDSEKRTLDQLLKGSLVTWTLKDSTILAAETTKTHTQQLFSFNLVFKTKTLLDDMNAQLPDTTFITALDMTGNASAVAFEDVEGNLFIGTQKEKKIRRIAEHIKMFAFSPDGKKLAFLTDKGNLSILFIEDFDGDIRKKEGDKIAVELPEKLPIEKIQWYADSYHLFITYPGYLSLAELDDRKPLNIFPLLERFNDYRYDTATKSILYTTENTIKTIRIEK